VPCHTGSSTQIDAMLNYNASIWPDPNDPLLDWAYGSLNPPLSQGLEIQPTAAPLLQRLEGEANFLQVNLNYPTAGPQPAAPSHHAESSNSSLARNEKKRRKKRSSDSTHDDEERPKKKMKRSPVFPAASNPGGGFMEFQLNPIELEVYEPIKYTRGGRMPAPRRRKTGEQGDGIIRGACSYGWFDNGWTNESEVPGDR